MFKIEIFDAPLDQRHKELQSSVNRFCQQVTTKGSVYAKVFDVETHIDSDSGMMYAVVKYDDGESERTAT